jgi:hypothetical protein
MPKPSKHSTYITLIYSLYVLEHELQIERMLRVLLRIFLIIDEIDFSCSLRMF